MSLLGGFAFAGIVTVISVIAFAILVYPFGVMRPRLPQIQRTEVDVMCVLSREDSHCCKNIIRMEPDGSMLLRNTRMCANCHGNVYYLKGLSWE